MVLTQHRRSGQTRRVALPMLLGVVVCVSSGVMWSVLRGQEERALARAVADGANQAARLIEVRSAERLLPFERMAERMSRQLPRGEAYEPMWREDALAYVEDHPELVAVEWVDASSRVRWVEPERGNEAVLGLEMNRDAARAGARDRSTAIGGPAMTGVVDLLQGGTGVLFFHPIVLGTEELLGHLVFVARSEALADRLLDPPDERFELAVLDGEHELLHRGSGGEGAWAGAAVEVAGRAWRVEARPTAATVALYRSHAPAAALGAGLVLGVAFFGVGLTALRSNRQRGALQRQSHELQAILDMLPAMVWHKDTSHHILRANKAAADAAGVAPDDMVGGLAAPFYPDTAHVFFRDTAGVVREGVPRLGVVEALDTDAGRRYIQTDKLPVLDDAGRVTGLVVIATDISHLRQAEAQARRATEWFQAFMAHDPEMKWALDTQGRFVYVNEAYQQAMGVTLEQSVGRLPIEVLPDRTKAFIRRAQKLPWNRPTLDQPVKNEVHLPTKDGVVPLLFTQFLFEVEGQVIEGGTAIDLTAIKQAEQQLARHNRDLETLLYVISHDLREPLRGIRNFTDIIVTGYRDKLDDRGRDMLDRVARGAQRLDRLLSDVLLLSRAQRAEHVDQEVDAEAVAREALRELANAIRQADASVTVRAPLPALRMDPFWLRQALINLLANALKFNPPGQTPDIEIDAYRPDPDLPPDDPRRDLVGLVVRDRGTGIEPDSRDKIFGLFQRGVARSVPGTGAGLAIVAQVARRYGGEAWVEPRPGGGSSFYLTIGPKGE